MGSELPVLEYARAERVGGDRYRLGFLLAGLPALIGAFVPIVLTHSLVWVMVNALREVAKPGFSSRSLPKLAIVTAFLAPLSAMVWRGLRLRGSEPGRNLAIIGLTLVGIHVAGILGLLARIVHMSDEVDRMVVMAAGVGVVLVVCAGVLWRSRTRLDLAAWVLLGLVGGEMAVWAIIGVVVLPVPGVNALGLVFLATALVRGVEFAHVLRSRVLADPRV